VSTTFRFSFPTKSNNVYACCFISILFTLRDAEPDERADNVNYIYIYIYIYMYTHIHTQDARRISVTFPLSLVLKVLVSQEVFLPTNYLGPTFLVCPILHAEPVLDLSVLIIDYLNKPLGCSLCHILDAHASTFLVPKAVCSCVRCFQARVIGIFFVETKDRVSYLYKIGGKIIVFIYSECYFSFKFIILISCYLSVVLRKLNQLYLPLFA
jgi:hypothetical protein